MVDVPNFVFVVADEVERREEIDFTFMRDLPSKYMNLPWGILLKSDETESGRSIWEMHVRYGGAAKPFFSARQAGLGFLSRPLPACVLLVRSADFQEIVAAIDKHKLTQLPYSFRGTAATAGNR